MRGFERTRAKRDLYHRVLGDGRYPVQVVWGANDPVLKLTTEGEAARRAADADTIHTLPAKHFLQEDQAPAVAEHIARIVTAWYPRAGSCAALTNVTGRPAAAHTEPENLRALTAANDWSA